MRLALTIVAIVFCMASLPAQHWRKVGGGTVGPTEVQTLYGDTVTDRLLAGGTFLKIINNEDTVLAVGQAAWNGTRWDSLAHRIQAIGGTSTQQTFWYLRFEGNLYACGGFGFLTEDQVVNRGLARLNETSQRWEALECANPNFEGMSTLVPKEPQGTLYATGFAGNICGFPQSCVFRYDGEAFHIWEPFNAIPANEGNYVGFVFDFEEHTYVTGLFRDPFSEGYVSLLRHNGTNWEYIPGWNTLSAIKEVSIRNGILYLAGAFRVATGGPGNLVVAYDGTTWNDLGGGLTYNLAPASSAALDLEWLSNELYTCGLFNAAGGVPADGIARWNGQQWCTLPGDFAITFGSEITLYDMAVWRDSLYVCGGFTQVDGEPIRKVAQWIGGDAVVGCSTPVAVPEHAASAQVEPLHITPLPVPHTWVVQFSGPEQRTILIVDALGKEVAQLNATGSSALLDLSAQAAGLYIVRVQQANGTLGSAKIIRP